MESKREQSDCESLLTECELKERTTEYKNVAREEETDSARKE